MSPIGLPGASASRTSRSLLQPNRPQPEPTPPSPGARLIREKACPFSWGPFPTGHQGSGLEGTTSQGRLTSPQAPMPRTELTSRDTWTLRTLRPPSQGQKPVLGVHNTWWPSLFPNAFPTGGRGQRSGLRGPADSHASSLSVGVPSGTLTPGDGQRETLTGQGLEGGRFWVPRIRVPGLPGPLPAVRPWENHLTSQSQLPHL